MQAETHYHRVPMGYAAYRELRCAQCSSADGPVYVRWGTSRCPRTAVELYSGVASGSYYNHKGGGSNMLCLHPDPTEKECVRWMPIDPIHPATYPGILWRPPLAGSTLATNLAADSTTRRTGMIPGLSHRKQA